MSDWVDIPIPHGAVQDGAGNVLPYVPITLKVKGTNTNVTHAADDTGASPTTGGLQTRPDGSIGTISARRKVQSGQTLVMTATVGGETQTWEVYPLSPSVERSVVNRASKLEVSGMQAFADEFAASPQPAPPKLSWSILTSFTSGLNNSAIPVDRRVHVPFDDARVQWVGGAPVPYPNAGYGSNVGGVSRINYDDTLSVYRVLSYACVEFDASYFEIIVRADPTALFRLWIDGQPHSLEPEEQYPPGATIGALYLLQVQFPTKAKRVIKWESEHGIFGGFVHDALDICSAPTGVGNGGALLIVGDSYSIADGPDDVRAYHNYALRLARRWGMDRVYICGVGGRGVNTDHVLNPGTAGKNYRASLIAERDLIPDDVRLIFNQGSTNDGNYSTSSAPLQAALAAELQALFDYEAEEWPDATIVLSSTLRCAAPTASDLLASGIYETASAARPEVIYVDQVAAGWFDDTNSDGLIQSDVSHPTATGHKQIADRIAAAVSSHVPVQTAKTTPMSRRFARRGERAPLGSAVLSADSELKCEVEANSVYRLTALIRYESAVAADFKFGFYGPSGTALYWGLDGVTDLALGDTMTVDGSGALVVNSVLVEGLLVIGDTPGTFGLQAAQGVLAVTNLFPNPDFETNITGLLIDVGLLATTGLAQSTGWASSGTHSAKLSATFDVVDSAWVAARVLNGGNDFAVTADHGYRLEAQVNVTDAATNGNGLYAVFFWKDSGGTIVGSTYGLLGNTAAGIQTLSVQGVAPAGATKCAPYIFIQSYTIGDTVEAYIDLVVFSALDTWIDDGSVLALAALSA